MIRKGVPRVSVIMSVYNGEKYLKEAIGSILNQTFKDFEFIIVDDGSTDKTGEILSSYEGPKIKIITQKHSGIPQAKNKAIKASNGEYIAIMDADDISLLERLELEVNFLDKNRKVGLVGSSFYVIDEEGKIVSTVLPPTQNKVIQERLLKENCFGHSTIMMRREILENVGYYREEFKYSLDYDLYLRIAECYKVCNLNSVLCKWRVNFQSVSVAKRVEQDKYAEFAKELVRERRKYGKDKLQTSSKEEIEKILREMLLKNKYKDKRILADGYFHGADLFYVAENYSEAKKWLVKSLQANFFNIKSWILFLKVMVCLKLSPKIIKGLKSTRERLLTSDKK